MFTLALNYGFRVSIVTRIVAFNALRKTISKIFIPSHIYSKPICSAILTLQIVKPLQSPYSL